MQFNHLPAFLPDADTDPMYLPPFPRIA